MRHYDIHGDSVPCSSKDWGVWEYSDWYKFYRKGLLVDISQEEYDLKVFDAKVPTSYSIDAPHIAPCKGAIFRKGNMLYFAGWAIPERDMSYHKLSLTNTKVRIELAKMRLLGTLPKEIEQLL